jgi:hypothetical protein
LRHGSKAKLKAFPDVLAALEKLRSQRLKLTVLIEWFTEGTEAGT